jgi:hypothetical protein
VSRAPLDKLKAFRHRMGWGFTRVSSGETDFNYDHHASVTRSRESGMAVFDDWSGDRGMLPGSRPSRCPAAVGADVSGVPDPVAGHLHVADYRSEGPRDKVLCL